MDGYMIFIKKIGIKNYTTHGEAPFASDAPFLI
jgi:hypothetical protein